MFDILRDGDEEHTKLVLSKRLEIESTIYTAIKSQPIGNSRIIQIELSMENRLVLKDHFRDSIQSYAEGIVLKYSVQYIVSNAKNTYDDDDDNNNNINDNSNHKSRKSSYSSILKIKANQETKDIYHNYTDMVTEQQDKLR
ncbi:hypothetical protein PPL_03681 [Heterostelium album PN500]|uniref:Uncharacterized protein n=1 Tax=Heterostelium pallidum (strain ATCC 26659 / Pp 5 / PN500) TaxID=670386 RepID=D3B6D3_HETP5|nr:hypothetical protein PPL_03681 [Heterostelium album PN500]EFA82903.1 hypothetical protein PPL_03681 [Heterostelium album PN500]|eukprot:XP_020435020.1 hypothetical protein PPL_03681 [Heterostelium album PN500]